MSAAAATSSIGSDHAMTDHEHARKNHGPVGRMAQRMNLRKDAGQVVVAPHGERYARRRVGGGVQRRHGRGQAADQQQDVAAGHDLAGRFDDGNFSFRAQEFVWQPFLQAASTAPIETKATAM